MNIEISRFFLKISTAAIILFATSHACAGTKDPIFTFTTSSSEVLVVVEKYFHEGDYVSRGVARRLPQLARRIGADHQYKLVTSLAEMSDWTTLPCDADGAPSVVIYDTEDWDETPQSEKLDIVKSIRKGASLVKASGCQKYGIAPSRAFLSHVDRSCFSVPRSLIGDLPWSEIDMLIIQSQGLLRDKCVQDYGTQNYVSYVRELARIARLANPNLVVLAEVSFNRSSPENITRAIDSAMEFVDGFYLAYPRIVDCKFCSVDGLEYVLSRYRSPLKTRP